MAVASRSNGSGYQCGANERQLRRTRKKTTHTEKSTHERLQPIRLAYNHTIRLLGSEKGTMLRYSIIERDHETKCYVNTLKSLFSVFLLNIQLLPLHRQHRTKVLKGK